MKAIEQMEAILLSVGRSNGGPRDLGVELPAEESADFTEAADSRRPNTLGIPVITATQMIRQHGPLTPRPTPEQKSPTWQTPHSGWDRCRDAVQRKPAVGNYPVEAVAPWSRSPVSSTEQEGRSAGEPKETGARSIPKCH